MPLQAHTEPQEGSCKDHRPWTNLECTMGIPISRHSHAHVGSEEGKVVELLVFLTNVKAQQASREP